MEIVLILVAGLLLLYVAFVFNGVFGASKAPEKSHLRVQPSQVNCGMNVLLDTQSRIQRFGIAPSTGHATLPHNHTKPSPRPWTYNDYRVGWICALPIEMAAARAMLDEVHADLPSSPSDDNTYILGRMCSHNVVVACLPIGTIGPMPAATVAAQMLATFRAIRFTLLVGVGGGIPNQADIRLGDVVVAKPAREHGGVVQYRFDKTMQDCTLEKTGMLSRPPRMLLTALSKLQAIHLVAGTRIQALLEEIESKYPVLAMALIPQFEYEDRLFRSDYHHHDSKPFSQACTACDVSQLHPRVPRPGAGTRKNPQIHYRLIASGTQVVKDSKICDALAHQFNILCFEMEAAGLLENFPCLVIRGIADYADSHKNDAWQGYAAATAAAYAKELLWVIPGEQVEGAPLIVGGYPQ